MRVLLVEDDPAEAMAMQRELAGRFEVRSVGTLAEALHVLGQGGWRPDVVLANASLPIRKGWPRYTRCRTPPRERRWW